MRGIRLENDVDAELQDARESWPRVEDAWEAVEWVLVRDPTVGKPVSESGQSRSFVYEGSYAHDMPNIEVLYVFDDQYVTIKSVRFSTPTFTAGSE